MFLQEPEASPYDFNFRVVGIPVRVHFMFWLVTIILGFNGIFGRQDLGPPLQFAYLFMWVGCVFVSILVHEMGHVIMGQAFGSSGYIVLTGFFGLAVGSGNVETRWQRILVSFAGPLAGFLLFGVVCVFGLAYDPDGIVSLLKASLGVPIAPLDWPSWLIELVFNLIWINLLWGLINLLPIWPLDGGQISRELFLQFCRNGAVRKALILSIVMASLFALNSLIGWLQDKPFIPYLPQGELFSTMFFGIFAFDSYQQLQAESGRGGGGWQRAERDDYQRAPWERDADWWKRG